MLWLQEGDKNSKLIHNSCIQCHNQNWIHSLETEVGEIVEGNEDIKKNLTCHFSSLLSDPYQDRKAPTNLILHSIPKLVSKDHNINQMREVTMS
jgi:hypothetical protein